MGVSGLGRCQRGAGFDLQVDEEGWWAMKKIGELSPGEERAVGTMVLHAPGVATREALRGAEDSGPRVPWDATVSGRVLDEEGKAAAGVRVSTSPGNGEGVSDLKGRFEMEGLPREGVVTVRAMDDELRGEAETHGGATGVEVRLVPMHGELIGKAPPALQVEQWYSGGVKGWEELKGKVVLVQIGVWPQGFEGQIGEMKDLYERFHGKGLEIVTIFQRANAWEVEELVKEEKVPWMVGVDAESKKGRNGALFAVRGGRLSLAVDGEGKVRGCVGKDVEGWVERLIGEKGN